MTRRSRRSRRSNASFVARDDDDDGRSVERSIDGMVWDGVRLGHERWKYHWRPHPRGDDGRRTTERAGSTTRMNERWRSEK